MRSPLASAGFQLSPFCSRWLVCLLLCAAAQGVAQEPAEENIVAEKAELTVQLDPEQQAIYGKVILSLRNVSQKVREKLTLRFSSPLAPGIAVKLVWDRDEDLPWRRLRAQETGGEYLLQLSLTRPLKPGGRILVGVSFELYFERIPAPGPVASITGGEARLAVAGWYPMPLANRELLPAQVRMAVRLPKLWKASSPAGLKRRRDGTLLALYELRWKKPKAGNADPDMVLFQARAPSSQP